jgi:hypothetical protein
MHSHAAVSSLSTLPSNNGRGPVVELFEQTPPDNIALCNFKLNTFGVHAEKPIMDLKTHSLFAALKDTYDDDAKPSKLFMLETKEGDKSTLDHCAQCHPPFSQSVANLASFPCLALQGDSGSACRPQDRPLV